MLTTHIIELYIWLLSSYLLIDRPVLTDSEDGLRFRVDRMELLEYNLESNLSHVSFRFQRSFFTCTRCTQHNYQLCCQRYQVCCHIGHRCPASDTLQCSQLCPGGCPKGQICCPRRRKSPCCTIPAHNYLLPPIHHMRANHSDQINDAENATYENGQANAFLKPQPQPMEFQFNINNESSIIADVISDVNDTHTQFSKVIAIFPQLSNETLDMAISDSSTEEMTPPDFEIETTQTDFEMETTPTDFELATTIDDDHFNTTTMLIGAPVTEPQPVDDQVPQLATIYEFNETTLPTSIDSRPSESPDDGSVSLLELPTDNSTSSEEHSQSNTSLSQLSSSTVSSSGWWNSDESTIPWENIDGDGDEMVAEDAINETSSFHSIGDSYVISYFPEEDDSLANMSKYDVAINVTFTNSTNSQLTDQNHAFHNDTFTANNANASTDHI